MKIDGKIAIVTGAGSGLGRATCFNLAAAGAKVAAFDVNKKQLAELQDLPAGMALTRQVDVADAQGVRDGIEAVLEKWGGVHIAVSCAGILHAAKTVSKSGPFPLEAWNEVIAVNLTGTFNFIRFSAPAMIRNLPDDENGDRGVIVNVSSGAAFQGQIGQAAYSASKAGIIGLTLPVARDLGEHAIRVVTIAPGLFETGMVAGMPPNVSQAIIDRMVLYPRRMGRPEEFAKLVRHIVENGYLNAVTINIDAGARMAAR
jgi:NAD(P)-dependent dehydrogenase (short-subunit alcohol dehydrogenase family)